MTINLYGGSMAIVALADLLVEREVKFRWFTLGEKLAGHFSGISLNGQSYDLGMVFLELDPGANNPLEYGGAKTESRAMNRFLEGKKIREASVKTRYKDITWPDYIICDNVVSFRQNKSFPTSAHKVKFHPREKWENEIFETLSFEEVCGILYPEFYATFLKDIADKITDGFSKSLSCRYHRSAWLPLYYPETICGDVQGLTSYPMYRPTSSSFSEIVSEKLKRIYSSKNVHLDTSKVELLDVAHLTDENNVKKFVGCDLYKIPGLNAVFDEKLFFRPLYDICILRLKSTFSIDFDCVFDTQDKYIFRITAQRDWSTNEIILICEARSMRQSKGIFESYCIKYVKQYLEINAPGVELCKTELSGPRMPKAGAENNLELTKVFIDQRYFSDNIFHYGLQNGVTAMSMNKQISHAINTWGPECLK